MDKKTFLRRHLAVNVGLIALFLINKHYLRPVVGDVAFFSVLLGCLPNLIGAFIFSLLPIGKSLDMDLRKGRMVILFCCITVFLFLTYEEFHPYYTASKIFDYADIMASAAGAAAAFVWYFHFSASIKNR